jgi:hypothetical protein
VQGVEGQGRLTRAADSGDHGQLITGDGQFHILEVVGAGSLDVDGRVQMADDTPSALGEKAEVGGR